VRPEPKGGGGGGGGLATWQRAQLSLRLRLCTCRKPSAARAVPGLSERSPGPGPGIAVRSSLGPKAGFSCSEAGRTEVSLFYLRTEAPLFYLLDPPRASGGRFRLEAQKALLAGRNDEAPRPRVEEAAERKPATGRGHLQKTPTSSRCQESRANPWPGTHIQWIPLRRSPA
jgi:hypothetical protein